MTEEQELEIRLWDYIDGNVDAVTRKQTEELLNKNPKCRQLYRQLMELHALINNDLEQDEPSIRFTKSVMEKVSATKIAPATHSYINKRIILAIGSFFVITITGILVYVLAQIDWTVHSDIQKALNRFDIATYLNRSVLNIFFMLNVLLGLVLLDRYLAGKSTHNRPAQH